MLIHDTHPMLYKAKEIEDLARDVLKKYDLNYFQFLTIFSDGSISVLCNQAYWIKLVMNHFTARHKPVIYSYLPKTEILDSKRYYFLWDFNLPQELIQLGQQGNIHHGLCFVEREIDRYHLISFAAPARNHSALDIYLNKITELTQFIQQFKLNHSKLIDFMDQHKIHLDPEQRDANLETMLLSQNDAEDSRKKRYFVLHDDTESYVTPRELTCLAHLSEGKTYKQIGNALSISPRTVETVIARIKDRLRASSRSDLVGIFHLARK